MDCWLGLFKNILKELIPSNKNNYQVKHAWMYNLIRYKIQTLAHYLYLNAMEMSDGQSDYRGVKSSNITYIYIYLPNGN